MNNLLTIKRVSLYSTILKLSAKEKSSNFTGWLIEGIQIALRLAIYSGMYRVALGASNSQYINGIWAIAIAQTIFGIERPQLSLQIGNEIKNGTMSMYLLRPLSYINQAIVSYLGRSIPGQSSIGFFAFSTAYLLTGKFPFSLSALPFIFGIILGGTLLGVLIEMFLGLTGFWTTDTTGVQLMNHKLNLLFGGIIIPFALLPELVGKIVRFTPWSVSAAQPGYVATHFSYGLYFEMLLVLIAWILFFYMLSIALYSKGIKKLSIGGG